MSKSSPVNYSHSLQALMQRVGFPSFKALSRAAGVSERQILRLRRGEVEQMRVDILLKLSQVLQVSLQELVATFSKLEVGKLTSSTCAEGWLEAHPTKRSHSSGMGILPVPTQKAGEHTRDKAAPTEELLTKIAELNQEYQRLQFSLAQQRELLWQEFQQSSLQLLESWLMQWPTAAQKAQENPALPAKNLLPLVKPVEKLIQQWGVEAIAPVGAELPYDPQWHQLIEGVAQPGATVKVRYIGYRHGNKLLSRAKVSPV